jgi:hypothetical protein
VTYYPQKAQSPGGAGQSAKEPADTVIVGQTPADRKTVATLKAQFALRGHAVHEMAGGGFIICRWGLVRACRDLEALQAFARKMGVIE